MRSLINQTKLGSQIIVVLGGFIFALIYCSPWIFLGQDSYVRIHDSLDSLFGWYVMLAREGAWFSSNETRAIPVLADGLPRVSLPSELTPVSLLFAHLEPFTAYVAHQIFIRFLAFTGMATLVLLIYNTELPWRLTIALIGASAFAAMPFWGWFGGSAAAPWVAVSLISLVAGKRTLINCLILIAYAAVSGIVMTGFVVIGLLWVLFLHSLVTRQRFGPLLAGAIVATLAYIVVDYRLFMFMLNPFFIPHRIEFVFGHTDLPQAVDAFWGNITGSAAAVPSAQAPVITNLLLVVLVIYGLWVFRGSILHYLRQTGAPAILLKMLKALPRISPTIEATERVLLLCLMLIVATALLTAAWEWSGLNGLRDQLELLKMFNFSRAAYFNPFIWSLMLVASCAFLAAILPRRLSLVVILVVLFAQLNIALREHEHFVEKRVTGISFRGFFADEIFTRIVSDHGIVPSETMVANVGLHPSITQVYGFRTFDAYLNFYPIDNKKAFRGLILEEFSRDPGLLSYLDDWGNRLYLFSSEVMCPRMGAVCTKDSNHRIDNLLFDFDGLRAQGVELIFSAIPIDRANGLPLQPIGIYDSDTSAWRIHVYRL